MDLPALVFPRKATCILWNVTGTVTVPGADFPRARCSQAGQKGDCDADTTLHAAVTDRL